MHRSFSLGIVEFQDVVREPLLDFPGVANRRVVFDSVTLHQAVDAVEAGTHQDREVKL